MTTRRLWIVCAVVALAGCAVLPRSRLTLTPYAAPPPEARWALGTVAVEHLTLVEHIRGMVDEAVMLVAAENGIAFADPGETPDVVADLWISEREFSRDLRSLNGITVAVTLRDAAGGGVLLRAAFVEETQDTLVSFYHLYSVLDMLCGSIAKQVRASARASAREAEAASR